ncbi:GntR family transcriptional regulator [Kozakia baliensis]|uniref:GntR family transcriptional regulator n=1 Tax=Kozakia baliensis TaxID=153496 RepID=UPI00068A39C3|nr:GntR family transcriptional regulator [Kozakia baliensis]
MYADITKELFPQKLEMQGGVPLRVQLREGLLAAIGDGRLKPGAQLPTMRELSAHLAIDLNTVQRAYAELERIGAIETRRARGSFVCDAAPKPDPSVLREKIEVSAAGAIAAARAQGLPPQDVAHAMLELLQRSE